METFWAILKRRSFKLKMLLTNCLKNLYPFYSHSRSHGSRQQSVSSDWANFCHWQNFKTLLQTFASLFSIQQNVEPTLGYFRTSSQILIVANGEILNKQYNNLVTLVEAVQLLSSFHQFPILLTRRCNIFDRASDERRQRHLLRLLFAVVQNAIFELKNRRRTAEDKIDFFGSGKCRRRR